jgi:hypothetical protein
MGNEIPAVELKCVTISRYVNTESKIVEDINFEFPYSEEEDKADGLEGPFGMMSRPTKPTARLTMWAQPPGRYVVGQVYTFSPVAKTEGFNA